MLESKFEPDGFNDSIYSISHKRELVEDLLALSMKQIQQDQQNDDELIAKVKKYTSKGLDWYTHKEVEGVELIHKHNCILVPEVTQ